MGDQLDRYTLIRTDTHSHTDAHTQRYSLHIHSYTQIHTHTDTFRHRYTLIHTDTHTHTHSYTQIHTCTHRYTLIHTDTHFQTQWCADASCDWSCWFGSRSEFLSCVTLVSFLLDFWPLLFLISKTEVIREPPVESCGD